MLVREGDVYVYVLGFYAIAPHDTHREDVPRSAASFASGSLAR